MEAQTRQAAEKILEEVKQHITAADREIRSINLGLNKLARLLDRIDYAEESIDSVKANLAGLYYLLSKSENNSGE